MHSTQRKFEGIIITMKVDITKDYGSSKSGKFITIASTEDNISVPGVEEVKVGLNGYNGRK